MSDFLADPFHSSLQAIIHPTKICSLCKQEKPFCEFHKRKTRKDGFQYYCKLCFKEYYSNNKEKINKRNKEWRINNKEEITKYSKEWRINNKEEITKYSKEYYINNQEEIQVKNNIYRKNRRKTDAGFRLLNSCRARLYIALKGNTKSKSTMELIGCSEDELKTHLKSQFEPGMTMENYGKWHVDHIVPCSAYDMSDPIEQQQCFHYTNLKPMWGSENQKKWKHWIV